MIFKPTENAQKVQRLMNFRIAHSAWLSAKISAVRRGEAFDRPEPQLENFLQPDGSMA